ncbi:coiled-coil domain-containing protein 171 [Pelobates fuscus]|uniref:coiled-coil domain-containing protein 171 n=1 Tax=Pelobates fuscus TaxID=191477 RepID=UPI002FE46540
MDKMTLISHNNESVHEIKRSEHRKLQKEEQSDFNLIAELRSKLNQAKNLNIELMSNHNQELSVRESMLVRLRSEFERGEAVRQSLEYELAVAKKQYREERMALEQEKAQSSRIQEQFKLQAEEFHIKLHAMEQNLQTAQYRWQDAQKRLENDLQNQNNIIASYKEKVENLLSEKQGLEGVLQVQRKTIQELQEINKTLLKEQNIHMDTLRQQKSELGYSCEREERLNLELAESTKRIKQLEGSIEAERAAHLESKFSSEVIQLRIRDLEGSLQVEKAVQLQTASDADMLKRQFVEVESAYQREKNRAEETMENFQKLQEEFSIAVKNLEAEIEEKNRSISELAAKLKDSEQRFVTMEEDLALSKKHQFSVEESYQGIARDLQSLVDSFNVSSQSRSGSFKDHVKLTGSAAVLETLRRTLTDYRSRLEDTSNEHEATKRVCEKMSAELESYKVIIQSLHTNLEKAESDVANAEKELHCLRSKCSNAESQIVNYQKDLEKVCHAWEAEKNAVMEMGSEIHKQAHVYQKDAEEKLTFLHSLYQRLVAGCVIIKHPENMFSNFSWSELCTVLQENVDTLISDLNQANEKAVQLEYSCKNKDDILQSLKKNHKNTLQKLSEQIKARESDWQKQRKDMELKYSTLLQEAKAKVQKFQRVAQKSESKIAVFEKTKNQMAFENVNIKNVLINSQKNHKSLLAACTLIAGALYPLYSRTCFLAAQRDYLQTQVNSFIDVQKEIGSLVQALSDTEEKKPNDAKVKLEHLRSMKYIFRKGVIAVLAANRFRQLGKNSRSLFTWMDSFTKSAGLLVCVGGAQKKYTLGQKDEEAWTWFTSTDLLNAVVYSMSELLEVLDKPESNSQDHLIKCARNSFSKLMRKLSVEMGYSTVGWDRSGTHTDSASLIQRLARGLCRLDSQTTNAELNNTRSVMKGLGVLKKKISEFTKRLYTGEVERRSLRLELSEFRENLNAVRKNSEALECLKEQNRQFRNAKMVPSNKFDMACEELHQALFREKQAQILLNEQSQQLQELNNTIQLLSVQEAEKNQTLSEAVKSLSEAKMELRNKDQSLRQVNRQLAQLEKDKRWLEESIHNAEIALCTAAKDKELIGNHMKSVEAVFEKVRDQMSKIWSTTTKHDSTLQLPLLHPEIFAMEGSPGGAQVQLFENTIRVFLDIYKFVYTKATALEEEITFHKNHIAALKSELQDACLRDNESLSLAKYDVNNDQSLSTEIFSESISTGFYPMQAEQDLSHSQRKRSFSNHTFDRLFNEASSVPNICSSTMQELPNPS